MARSKPLVIELTKATGAFPKGTQLGVDKESDAAKLYSSAYTIVGYQDGSAYEAPAPAQDEPAEAAAPEGPAEQGAPEETAPTAEQQEV